MIIIPGQSGTYRHSRRRVTDLLAESGLTLASCRPTRTFSEASRDEALLPDARSVALSGVPVSDCETQRGPALSGTQRALSEGST